MKKINWGVLGTAGIAKGHTIPGMQKAENCNLYAIAGRKLEKALDYQKQFGFEKVYDSYEALLADPNVEAVYIPLPNTLHYEWTIKALEAKKHVLCEKPLAPTPEEVEKMHAVAKENGVLLMEAYAYLHSPFLKAIKDEIKSGAIGDVLYIEAEFVTSYYDVSNIRMRKETMGGCTYDLGCYCTSLALWLMEAEPEKVQAIASFSPENVDHLTSAILTFPGGQRALLTSGMVLAKEKSRRIDRWQIHGTAGCIKSHEQFNNEGQLSYCLQTEAGREVKTVTTPHNYALEVEQLGRCITQGEQPHVSREFSLANSRVLKEILDQIGY